MTYETIYLDFNAGQNKSPEFTSKYNPNGRIPVLVDHKNNDFILWCDAVVYITTFLDDLIISM